MPHQKVRFNLPHGIQGNAYCDQQRSAAEVEIHSGNRHEDRRHQGDHRQESRACKGQAGQNLIQIFRSGFARAQTRDKAAVLPQIICHVNGIERSCRIEIRKEEDQHSVKDNINRVLIAEHFTDPNRKLAFCKEAGDHRGESQQRHGEDDRDRKSENQGVEGQQEGVTDELPSEGRAEKLPKPFESHKLTGEHTDEAIARTEVGKRHIKARHGEIAKYQIIQNNRYNHHQKVFIPIEDFSSDPLFFRFFQL